MEVIALQIFDKIQRRIQNFKAMLKDTYDVYRKSGLYTLKFHLLDYVIEYLNLFGCLELLNCSAYECFNVFMKRAFHSTSHHYKVAFKNFLSAVRISTSNRRQGVQ